MTCFHKKKQVIFFFKFPSKLLISIIEMVSNCQYFTLNNKKKISDLFNAKTDFSRRLLF